MPGCRVGGHLVAPGLAEFRGRVVDDLEHLAEHGGGIATETGSIHVMPTQLLGGDVELDDLGARWWHLPASGHLAAGAAADKKDEVGFEQCLVGALAAVVAGDADVERVVGRDRVLGVERRGDGDAECFGQFQE